MDKSSICIGMQEDGVEQKACWISLWACSRPSVWPSHPHCRSGQRQQPSPKDSWPFTSEACYEIKRLSNEQCLDLGDIRRILEPRVVAQPSNLSTQEVESGK